MSTEGLSNTASDEPSVAATSDQADGQVSDENASKQKPAKDDSESSDESEKSSEGEGHDDEESSEETESQDDKRKKRSGYQRRVEKLKSKLSEKDQEIEYLRARAFGPKTEEPTRATEQASIASPDKPRSEQFDTHEEYVEAIADWKFAQLKAAETAQRKQSEAIAHSQKVQQAHNARVQKFMEKNEDYADVVSAAFEDLPAHVPFSEAVEQIVKESDNGPELLFEICKDPKEFARICGLSSIAAARELGRLEAKILKSTPTVESKKSNAPPPLAPVGSKSSAIKKSIYDSGLSFTEFERLRNEELKNKK